MPFKRVDRGSAVRTHQMFIGSWMLVVAAFALSFALGLRMHGDFMALTLEQQTIAVAALPGSSRIGRSRETALGRQSTLGVGGYCCPGRVSCHRDRVARIR